jgi:hypothetical protein
VGADPPTDRGRPPPSSAKTPVGFSKWLITREIDRLERTFASDRAAPDKALRIITREGISSFAEDEPRTLH